MLNSKIKNYDQKLFLIFIEINCIITQKVELITISVAIFTTISTVG